jgi:N-acetylneuraminic acid mutarotase
VSPKYFRKLFITAAILIPTALLSLVFLTANAKILDTSCPDISIFPCTGVKLFPDIIFEFDSNDAGLTDLNGVGLGFTMVDPPTNPENPVPNPNAPGYWPEKLEIISDTLVISTTNGLMVGTINGQDNALGIGMDMGGTVILETTITDTFPAPGNYVQAGLWFGKSDIGPSGLGGTGTVEDNYAKLVLITNSPGVWRVQTSIEVDGVATDSPRNLVDGDQPLTLQLALNPSLGSITARYCNTAGCDPSEAEVFQTFNNVPSDWFSTDAAGIDLEVGTRSMGGIFASHRNNPDPVKFTFENFVYRSGGVFTPATSKDGVDFDTWVFKPVDKPTAMAWGPDDRLYVSDVTGFIHVFTLDHENQTISQTEVITTVQYRLMLGLTIDPASTPEDVILWVAHSDLNQFDGEANSGTITRLSGAGFTVRQDVITGLPRAIANHGTNNIHFGPDGRLYIAQGGNTGAGGSNDGGSEFGPRPEQPLSAAILVADVNQAEFDGSCASEIDPDGSIMDSTGISATDIPCDVAVYASGLRNAYDLTWHTNGEMYATENGLGVIGTFPDLLPNDLDWDPLDGCEGMVMGTSQIQAHFPGERPDLLHRITDGGYYGHPNPSRDECVFFGANPTSGVDYLVPVSSAVSGTISLEATQYLTGLVPQAGFIAGMLGLGDNKSANGIIEYNSGGNAFCGRMDGDLLVTYFSQDDQVRRFQLAGDGLSVISDETLIRSSAAAGGTRLSNPLPLTQDPTGRLYVGEFGFSQVRVFEPKNIGLWTEDGVLDLPVALLDPGYAVLDQVLYLVGGKTSLGHQKTVYAFNPYNNIWESKADLPAEYPAVENPAVIAYDGKLYAFGGSTAPFSGAVAKTAVYDPNLDQWTMLADMPTARGGLTAEVLGDMVYVIGGLDAAGDSVSTVEVFDPAAGTWSAGVSLPSARDNAASAVLNGRIFLFGGRLRSGGSNLEPTLQIVESFGVGDLSWSSAALMPTGRRAASAVVVEGRAIIFGGEKTSEGGTFTAVEAYDPVEDKWELLTDMPIGRHGAAAGLVGNAVLVVGGGPQGGTSYTADVDRFHFDCEIIQLVQMHDISLPLVFR